MAYVPNGLPVGRQWRHAASGRHEVDVVGSGYEPIDRQDGVAEWTQEGWATDTLKLNCYVV